jgi:hypothetical protein
VLEWVVFDDVDVLETELEEEVVRVVVVERLEVDFDMVERVDKEEELGVDALVEVVVTEDEVEVEAEVDVVIDEEEVVRVDALVEE